MTRTQFALIRGMVLAVGLVSCSWGGEQSNPEDFLGWWYMGTMTGQDTNLNILPNGKLAIQCGGCFKQDPWIYSSWRRHEDKIIITDLDLQKKFGTYLRIAKYKNNILLVPKAQESEVKRTGFTPAHFFCKNLRARGGLQLPPDAKDFAPRPSRKGHDKKI